MEVLPDAATDMPRDAYRRGSSSSSSSSSSSAAARRLPSIWPDATPNPYLGLLAWADGIWSHDSINMVSEACGTAKPVYVSRPRTAHAASRPPRAALAKGCTREWQGTLEQPSDWSTMCPAIRRQTSCEQPRASWKSSIDAEQCRHDRKTKQSATQRASYVK